MWDERYGRPGFAFGTEANDFLVAHAGRIPVGPVLSLGEGEGRNAVHLAALGHRVTAVDRSVVGLRKARRLAAERATAIRTVAADLGELEIAPGHWAGIVSIFCHTPPPLRRRLHRRVAAGLRPGGVFLLEAYTPRQLRYGTGGPPTEELLVSLEELREELTGLELRLARELERDVVEGTFHTGRAHVVQVIAARPGRG